MRNSGPAIRGAKRMVPWRFHVPPRPANASASIATVPPAMSALLSFPSAKKPIRRLSGDQKGKLAPVVPLSCCAPEAANERTHSVSWPSGPRAMKARRVPSGETAKLNGSKDEPEGGRTEDRPTCEGLGRAKNKLTPKPIAGENRTTQFSPPP